MSESLIKLIDSVLAAPAKPAGLRDGACVIVVASAKTFAELPDKLDRSKLGVTVIELIENPGIVVYHPNVPCMD